MADLTRFTLNSTLGLGGLLDIGSEAGLQKYNEDFGQTLGAWGVPPGPAADAAAPGDAESIRASHSDNPDATPETPSPAVPSNPASCSPSHSRTAN